MSAEVPRITFDQELIILYNAAFSYSKQDTRNLWDYVLRRYLSGPQWAASVAPGEPMPTIYCGAASSRNEADVFEAEKCMLQEPNRTVLRLSGVENTWVLTACGPQAKVWLCKNDGWGALMPVHPRGRFCGLDLHRHRQEFQILFAQIRAAPNPDNAFFENMRRGMRPDLLVHAPSATAVD